MKNIVVIGGTTPGKFGHEFVTKTRAQGHRVKVLTWREPESPSQDVAWADFSNHDACVTAFNQLVSDMEHIDVMLYNAQGGSYANEPFFFTSGCHHLDPGQYLQCLNIQVIVPHALSLAALKKMDQTSALVFMTTGLALDHTRDGWTDKAGYAGSKSWQTHMMLAFAHHNDKQAISVSISPFFPYSDPELCTRKINSAVDMITNLNKNQNGQILFLP